MNPDSRQRFKSAAGPCQAPCSCQVAHGHPRFVVLTGGPGAGKTAVLELARQRFCRHVLVLQESASILFGGGFPRKSSPGALKAAQRAIFHVQAELERVALEEPDISLVLCDRGTLDGLAYWPDSIETFERDLSTSREIELARYDMVLCLRPPPARFYNHRNPLRVESAQQAQAISQRIEQAWTGHPNLSFIESSDDFFDKARRALERIALEIPGCCRASAPVPLDVPSPRPTETSGALHPPPSERSGDQTDEVGGT